jgi:WD40 repeat protein
LATGRRIESILTNLDSVSAADFSADGQRVALGYHNGTVQVWNLISGAPVGLPFQHQGPIQNLEFSPGGLQLVTAGDDGFACVWDLPSGNLAARMKHTGPLSYATFAADGKSGDRYDISGRDS